MKILRFNIDDKYISDVFDIKHQHNVTSKIGIIDKEVLRVITPRSSHYTRFHQANISLNEEMKSIISSYHLYGLACRNIDLIVSDEDAMMIRLSYKGELSVLDL